MMSRDEQLRIANVTPGTPQAAAFQNRLTDQSVTGFFSLANLFASLVILMLLAAVGLAADKLIHARQARTLWAKTSPKGELHTPTVAAWLTIVVAAAILPVLILTRSRGGIIAGLGALIACTLIYRYRDGLARNWKKALIVVAIVLGLGSAAVVAYGLKYDRLPSKTLTFRWYYWTASGKIIRRQPLWGVGPGNFPSAYLAARRPAAEEAVNMPHNFVMRACGVRTARGPVLHGHTGVCDDRHLPADREPQQAAGRRDWACPVRLHAARARAAAGGASAGQGHLWRLRRRSLAARLRSGISDDPAADIAGDIRVAGPGAPEGTGPARESFRIAVGCALAGFILHNLIEFGLFMPGTATMFWVSAGAAASGRRRRASRPYVRGQDLAA